MTPPPAVRLRPGREAPSLGRHPWVFSGSVGEVEGAPAHGEEVRLVTADGDFVARGLYNGKSQIRVRLYRWEDRSLDEDFWEGRLEAALRYRRELEAAGQLPAPGARSGARLVFSEGDGLSGLTVDRFGDWLSVIPTSLAVGERLESLLELLESRLQPRGIFLRTEKGVGEEEGLVLRDGLARGEPPTAPVLLEERGLTYQVELATGQKSGFYLDQRENRAAAARWASGRRVADVCCYSGAFALSLAAAGARSVVGVDSSAPALELAERNAATNGLADRTRFLRRDAFRWLEEEVEAGRRYDMVVLDPPRFARSRRGVPSALKGYRRLNELAVRALEPGGVLVTCSCSGRVGREEFHGVLSAVAAATGRHLRVVDSAGQAPDHPVSPSCPETSYLKCVTAVLE